MSNTIQFKSITLSNGETLAYQETGLGKKVLILIHGNTGSSKHWDLLIKSLPEEYKIYAVDMRGFGDSTYNKSATSIKDYASDLKLFVDSLGLTKFNLSGWSLGGAICMQFAAEYPEYVEKLILLASANIKGYTAYKKNHFKKPIVGQYISTPEEIAEDLKVMIKSINQKTRWLINKLLDYTLFNITKPSESLADEFIDIVFKQKNLIDVNYALIHFNISNEHSGVEPGTGEVDKIVAPTLILQGDKDVVISVDVAKEIQAGIGNNANLVILEGCSHFPLIDNIDLVTKEYIDFIEY